MIASLCGDDVILRRCALASTSEARSAMRSIEAHAPRFGYRLELLGFGQTQAAVSQLVLKLESSSLFETVTLLETRREPYRERTAIAFRIECRITPEGRHE